MQPDAHYVDFQSFDKNYHESWDIESAMHPQTLVVYSLHIVARPSQGPPPFRRGDANGDATTDISDAVFTLLWLFASGKVPPCADAADMNDDEKHDLSDAIFLLQFLFRGGPAPPAPGPFNCGSSLTPSTGCESYPAC